MIVVMADTPAEADTMRQILAGVHHRGDDRVRQLLDDVRHVFIGRQTAATVVSPIASCPDQLHAELMTRTDTAHRLSCSTTTVDRLAAAGSLDKRNGKITTLSIDRYLRGESE